MVWHRHAVLSLIIVSITIEVQFIEPVKAILEERGDHGSKTRYNTTQIRDLCRIWATGYKLTQHGMRAFAPLILVVVVTDSSRNVRLRGPLGAPGPALGRSR